MSKIKTKISKEQIHKLQMALKMLQERKVWMFKTINLKLFSLPRSRVTFYRRSTMITRISFLRTWKYSRSRIWIKMRVYSLIWRFWNSLRGRSLKSSIFVIILKIIMKNTLMNTKLIKQSNNQFTKMRKILFNIK